MVFQLTADNENYGEKIMVFQLTADNENYGV